MAWYPLLVHEQQSHKILRIRVRLELELVGKTHVCLFQIRIMHHVDRKLQWPNPPPPPPFTPMFLHTVDTKGPPIVFISSQGLATEAA